jgi:hypothetical protein
MAIGMATAGAVGIKALLAKLGMLGAKAGAAKAAGVGAAKMAGSKGFKSALGKVLQKGFYPDAAQPVLQQVAGRVAPDVLFGGMAAMQTPGDIGDKLIAGGTQMIGGGLGGGLVTGTTGGRLGVMGELVGGVGGDYVGMFAGDSLMRGKDKISGGVGQTPYERMNAEQQEQFAEQIRNETLRAAGIIPGVQSQYFGDLGLS